jgi:hypothetical protein
MKNSYDKGADGPLVLFLAPLVAFLSHFAEKILHAFAF